MRLKEIDQDKYEATGIMYRVIDKYGYEDAPALLIERVRVDGEWRDGRVVSNFPVQDVLYCDGKRDRWKIAP